MCVCVRLCVCVCVCEAVYMCVCVCVWPVVCMVKGGGWEVVSVCRVLHVLDYLLTQVSNFLGTIN